MASLYDLTVEALTLQELACVAQDEASTEDVLATISEAFDALQGELGEKLEACCQVIAGIKGEVAALKEEEQRLSKRRKAKEAGIERLRNRMLEAMQAAGMEKSKGLRFSIATRETPGRVEYIEGEEIPEAMMVPQPAKPNAKAISEALKDGEFLPYARLVIDTTITIR